MVIRIKAMEGTVLLNRGRAAFRSPVGVQDAGEF
jgi:hypothetical protein